MISHYSFGNLIFKNTSYNKDLIIIKTSDGEKILSNWWRKEGHRLQVEDLEEVWKSPVKYLIVGTGASGLMKVDSEVEKKAKELNIKLEAYLTDQAVKRFNELYSSEASVAGAFHLTC
ncbi:MAG: hypothetical protein C0190_03210 [Thermodesulfobacterium geofontis]|uniref:Uncharacterized protein n=1 Tax=Thermodesulfobacterium geofontis TaxID=1295609 RepID=A0A2N7PNY1_9BACT|nr:MAG: hypothetical protein C0190_03210 [Thermodesulfobacterium geofontis]PMP94194.1 MAG: hypothetical protein C0169_06890 [Thermodesulfobacterium geofontis]